MNHNFFMKKNIIIASEKLLLQMSYNFSEAIRDGGTL